jgi:hypothetical protein
VGQSEVPKLFYERYELLEEHPFFINCFQQVGLSDPFPKGGETPADVWFEDIQELVYPEGRFTEGQRPFQIYIPKKELMFNLMRSCVDVSYTSHII